MPIETIFAKNHFLALMPLLGISTVRFIRGTHSVKKLGDTTTSATAITVLFAVGNCQRKEAKSEQRKGDPLCARSNNLKTSRSCWTFD
jgi:hypothetical protein